MVEVGKGGTNQARWEREVINQNIVTRLGRLELGRRSLCFGRIDQEPAAGGGTYHIGRIAVSDRDSEPLIVDWRAPVAEPFYRSTGSEPMGLVRRRHFVSRGRELIGLEDEFFGEARAHRSVMVNGRELRGEGALVAALSTARTGRLGDIVGTIQAEQDEIVRAPLAGVLVVQGGPGTGKTVVALHRAAYLLYTHRFPLDGQGVLVIGPNRLFLGYIEQVLPSLGEAGVAPARSRRSRRRGTGSGRRPDRGRPDQGRPPHGPGRCAGRSEIGRGHCARLFGSATAPASSAAERSSSRRTSSTKRGPGFAITTPPGVSWSIPCSPPWSTITPMIFHLAEVRSALRKHRDIREALDWMWPVLNPGQLLHDLFGSRSLIASAGGRLDAAEREALYRRWEHDGSLAAGSGPPTMSRCWTRRGRCSAGCPGMGSRTTLEPTATSWSTRPRICRRCSCEC